LTSNRATRCQAHAVPTADLDAAVWADVRQMLTDPAILAEAVQRARDGWLDESARAARQHDLRTRVGTLERQRQRLIDTYATEAVTLEELRPRVQALEARLADLAHEEQQLVASVDHAAQIAAVATQLDTFRAAVAQGLDHASFARRRELVELLVDRVLVEPSEVEIRYVIPFGGVAHRKVGLRLRHQGATCRRDADVDDAARWRTSGRISGTTAGPSRTSGARLARPAAPPRPGS